MLNSVREDTAMVTALLGLGCKSKADNCLQQLWTTNNLLYVVRCAALLSLAFWRTIYTASELRDALERARFQSRQLSLIIVYVLSSLSRLYHCILGIGCGRRCCHSQLVNTNSRLPDGASSLFSRCQIMLWQLPSLFLHCCRSWTVLLSQCLHVCSYCCCIRGTELLRPASLLCGCWVPLSISTTQWRHQSRASVSHNDLHLMFFSQFQS